MMTKDDRTPPGALSFWKRPLRLDLISKYRNELYGLAIVWIVIFHGRAIDSVDYSFGRSWLNWFDRFIATGNVGVDLFLFLSGVCMFYSFSKNPDVLGFYKKRLVRIVPAVWIINGLYWLVKFAIIRGNVSAFLTRMALVQFWVTGDSSIWFVSLIVVLYLLYPLIYKVLFSREDGAAMRCALLMATIYVAVACFSEISPDYYDKVEIALTRIPAFLLGCYMGKQIKEGRELPPIYVALAFVGVVAFFAVTSAHILSGMHQRFFMLVGGISIAYLAAIVFECACNALKNPKPALHRFLAFVGTFSLELYLAHIMLNQLLRVMPWYVAGTLWQYAIVVILAFPLAWATSKLVDLIRRVVV